MLAEAAKGRIKLLGIEVTFEGTLRLAASIAGIILIGAGVAPGLKKVADLPIPM